MKRLCSYCKGLGELLSPNGEDEFEMQACPNSYCRDGLTDEPEELAPWIEEDLRLQLEAQNRARNTRIKRSLEKATQAVLQASKLKAKLLEEQ